MYRKLLRNHSQLNFEYLIYSLLYFFHYKYDLGRKMITDGQKDELIYRCIVLEPSRCPAAI